MREKRIGMIINILNQIIYFYAVFCLAGPAIYLLTGAKNYVLFAFFLLPVMILSILSQSYCHHIILYLLIHISMVGATFLFPNRYISLIFVILIVLLCIYGISERTKEHNIKKTNATFFALALPAVGYILCVRNEITFFFAYITYGLAISCIIYCINIYFVNYYRYLCNNPEDSSLPPSQLNKTSAVFLSIFSVLNALLMLLITKLPIKRILSWIGYYLKKVFIFLLSLIIRTPDKTNAPLTDPEVMPTPELDMGPKPETNRIMQIIGEIFTTVCLILIIVVIIGLIVLACYRIYQSFHQVSPKSVDQREFINPFAKQKLVHTVPEKEKKVSFLSALTNNNFKIRRHFYHQLKPHISTEKAPYYTSKQMIDTATTPTGGLIPDEYNKNEVDELHKLYDKARYSNMDCSKQEYQNIKKIRL